MRGALVVLLCLFAAAGCSKAPGEPGRGDETENSDRGAEEKSSKPPEKKERRPEWWFDRFMVELPGGGKILVEPSGDKLKKMGKLTPEAFRKAVTRSILSVVEGSVDPLLVDLKNIELAAGTGDQAVEFRLGDYAELSEVECSESK